MKRMSGTRTTTPGHRESLAVAVLGLNDAGEILTLQRAAFLTEAAAHNDFRIPPLTQTLAELEDELADPDVTALGVRDGGRLIGAVRLRRSENVAELGRLIVAPDRQGQGIGTRLLLHTETTHAQVQEMRLFTGEHSIANLRLYARHGYHETSRTPAGDYQLVHLAKTLR